MYRVLFLLVVIFFSCKKNYNLTGLEDSIDRSKYSTPKDTSNDKTHTLPVKTDINKLLNEAVFCEESNIVLDVKETDKERIIKFDDIELRTSIDKDNAFLYWKDLDSSLTHYSYGHLDYEFDENEKGFMFFKCNEVYSLLFLEVQSEEFLTFQKIRLDTNGGKITVLGDFTISLENMERISKINKEKVKFFVTKIDNEDVLVSKNDKGDLFGVYNEKSSEGISQISFLKGQIVYPQVETYLNVRSAPNSKGAIVAEAYPEDALTVLEVLDGWVKVSLNGTEGYVSSDYVK